MGRERGPVLWRSAFQAHRSCTAYPRTSSPVTVATLRSAFQALSTYASALLREIAKYLTVFQALDTYASALLRVIAKSLTVFQALNTYASALLRVIAKSLTVFQT